MSKKTCPACNGDCKCPKCNGTGGGLTYVCSTCNGSKKCPRCNGTGVVDR